MMENKATIEITGINDGKFVLEGHAKTNHCQALAELMNSVHHRLNTERKHLSLAQIDQVLEHLSRSIAYLWAYTKAPKCTNQTLINDKPLVPILCSPPKRMVTPQEFVNILVIEARNIPGLKPWISAGSIRIARQQNGFVKNLFVDRQGEWACDFDELDGYFGTPKAKEIYRKIYNARLKWKEKVDEYKRQQKRKGEVNS